MILSCPVNPCSVIAAAGGQLEEHIPASGRSRQHLQIHDLAKSALRVRRVLERVEDLLQGDDGLGLLVDRFEDHSVGTLPELLGDLILA